MMPQCSRMKDMPYCTTVTENLLIGMGNPLLDITATVDRSFLCKYGLKTNETIIAKEKHKNLFIELIENHEVVYSAGGSVQNSLRVAQWIIEKPRVTVFLGCVGQDAYSKILYDRAIADGINVQYQYDPKLPTGTCAVLITDYFRSLCANLGAANCFSISHILRQDIKNLIDFAMFYYVSGFFLAVSPLSVVEVAKVALSYNRPFILNLSAPFISRLFMESLMQIMPYADVVFGNEIEAQTFAAERKFKTVEIREIALTICDLPKLNVRRSRTVIITRGQNPVILARNNKVVEFPVMPVPSEKLVDTHGARDALVGGFLSQYIKGQDLDVCIKCGIWAATQILQSFGCSFQGKATFKPETELV